MQPYRALIKNKQYTAVYAAMLSTNKDGTKMIYIVEKHLPEVPAGQMSFLEDENLASAKDLAHRMSTTRNSDIVHKYKLIKFPTTPRTYSIHKFQKSKELPTDVMERTQYDCLRAALADFCETFGYEILQTM